MTGCAHTDCVDAAHVTLRFPGGATREYCEHHARHVAEAVDGVDAPEVPA